MTVVNVTGGVLEGCCQVTATASLSPSLFGMNVVGQEGDPDENELSMSFNKIIKKSSIGTS